MGPTRRVALMLTFLACSRTRVDAASDPRSLASAKETRDTASRVVRHATSASARASVVSTAVSDPPQMAPLAAPSAVVDLDVEGFGAAVVALPLGAREARPVWVAVHGNFDRPEWQCQVWRGVAGPSPFILCPRGTRRADAPRSLDRWTYASAGRMEREITAALTALEGRFDRYAGAEQGVFIGFSLGAIYGVPFLRKHARRFPRAVLVEGGFDNWSLVAARDYSRGGGRRVLFACGQASCRPKSQRARRTLERAGIEARVAYDAPAGHAYDGPVADAVAQNLDWLLEGGAKQ